MIQEVELLVDSYQRWLKSQTTIRDVGGSVEITTPFLDRHNDMLQIFVTKEQSGFLLSDDGYIIDDLKLSGFNIDTSRRKQILRETLNGFGVDLDDNHCLTVRANDREFPSKKHDLIQAMLAVNDMFHLAPANVASLFMEDVYSWLFENDVRFSQKVSLSGRSGLNHVIPFMVGRSRQAPERMLDTITKPNSDSIKSAVFKFLDIRDQRPEARPFVVLNDTVGGIAPELVDALTSYSITPIPWSRREQALPELVA